MGPESQIEFADFFSDDFEEILIALFARDEPFFMRVQGLMKPAYFRAMVRKRICRAILDHFSATSTFLGDLTHLLAAKSSESGENEETKTAIAAEVHRIQEMQDDDLETQRTECEKMFARFAQRSEFMVLLNEGGAKNPKYDIDKFSEKLRGVLEIPGMFEDLGISVRQRWRDATEPDERLRVNTGFITLDHAMRGGMKEGEICVYLGPAKSGKSIVMMNLAAGMMAMGFDIVYYTLEMSALDVVKRVVAQLAHKPTNHLDEPEYIADIKTAMEAIRLYTTSDIIVKRFPALSSTVADLDGHYEMLKAERRKVPGVAQRPLIPIVDYGTLLVTSKEEINKLGAATWLTYPMIMLQLREWGIRRHVPVITAHQTNRAGMISDELNETHIAGASAIAAHVDYMFAIDQSKDDYKARRFRLTPFLSRNTAKDAVTYWKGLYDESSMEELSLEEYTAMCPNDGEAPPKRRRAPGGRA